jgi:hypothetical protein
MAVKSTPQLFAGHKLKLREKAEEESPNSDDRAETNHFASLQGGDCDVSTYLLCRQSFHENHPTAAHYTTGVHP